MVEKQIDWAKPIIIGGKHPMYYLYAISMRGHYVDDLELKYLDNNQGNVLVLLRCLKPMGWEQKEPFKRAIEKGPRGTMVVNSVLIGKKPALRG